MRYSKDNPYNDYSVYLHDLTRNGDEYFNEQICTEYKLKHNYHMVLLICGIFKNDANELIYKIDSQT